MKKEGRRPSTACPTNCPIQAITKLTPTAEKRIAKKREFVLGYLLRQEMLKDPLEKDGGSVSALRRELQAIHDLEEWRVAIRRAIRAGIDQARPGLQRLDG